MHAVATQHKAELRMLRSNISASVCRRREAVQMIVRKDLMRQEAIEICPITRGDENISDYWTLLLVADRLLIGD